MPVPQIKIDDDDDDDRIGLAQLDIFMYKELNKINKFNLTVIMKEKKNYTTSHVYIY